MKAALLLPLLLRLAAARPVLDVVDGAGVDAPHSPPQTRIKPETAEPVLNGGAQSLEPIDNRPQMPPSSAIPSVVLAEQKPIPTTYLLSLPRKGHKNQAVASAAAAVTSEKVGTVDQTAETPASQGHQPTTTTTTAHPCHRAFAAYRHRVEVAVIFLVALFVAVIVKAESGGSRDGSSDGTNTNDGPTGVIRLEVDQPSIQQPLSIQAEYRHEQAVLEKVRL
ncbi:hypothetical protein RB595_003207 [Gaeumannomyces hyphopodioides]